MTTSEDIVRQFCDAGSKRDTELLRPLLADDIVFHNIGMTPTIGVEDVLANLVGQWQMFPGIYEYRLSNIASAGDMVLTERVDVVGAQGQSYPVPVMGAFEVRDAKISHWRDYFDLALVGKMMSGEDVSDLVP